MTLGRIKMRAYAFLILLTLIGIFLNVISRNDSQERALQNSIHEVQQLDALLNSAVLKLRYDKLGSYDSIELIFQTIAQHRAAWRDQQRMDTPDLKEALIRFDNNLAEVKVKIDGIKSHNAVLHNSLLHFPELVNRALTDLPHSSAREERRRLIELLSLGVMSLSSQSVSTKTATKINGYVSQLRNGIPLDSASHETIQNLLKHTETIVLYGRKVDELVEEITFNGAPLLGAEVESAYNEALSIEKSRANLYAILLFLIALGLGGLAFITFERIRSKSRVLQEAVQELENFKHAIDAHAIVSITDVKGNITYANEKFCQISGYSDSELRGKNHRIIKSDEHPTSFFREMWQAIARGLVWQGQVRNRKKDGGHYWTEATIVPFMGRDNKPEKYISIRTDITELKESHAEIEKLAFYDPLTGIPNRRLFLDRLDLEIKKARRADDSLALLFIDLDRFKDINDSLGHAKGDILLVEVSNRIKRRIRETDTVARLGGDEFAIILPSCGDRHNINRIADDLLFKLRDSFDLGEGDVGYISGSIGIASYPEDAQNIDGLLLHADQAMYDAKAAGKNCYSYFMPSMQKDANDRRLLIASLRTALANSELEVYYQPIVNLKTARIEKAEALLRWTHPERGMVSPAVFIPLAEELGLIQEIGNWVFFEVASKILEWREKSHCQIQVSVNRSPAEFGSHAFNWVQILEKMGLSGSAITMEITEGSLLEDSKHVQESLSQCRLGGIEVSLDDFGTGHSQLSYLRQFDIDYLKIDQTFVRNLTTNENESRLVQAIIVMAHTLGIKTIAEGVETIDQRDLLISFGCDFVQGYLYSRPVPAADFEKMLLEQNQTGLTISRG
jgi:diguanylate cyclase (GGDEF)-like protein/PAS domain S-box-containing protein